MEWYGLVWCHDRDQDLSQYRDKITVDSEESSSWSLLSKSSKLSKAKLPVSEIELPFLIAQVEYSPQENSEHLNFLRNIYKVVYVSRHIKPTPHHLLFF